MQRGFLQIRREKTPKRAIDERLRDYREIEGDLAPSALEKQAARCMDCGVAFCHQGCPLGNRIPEWNALVERGELARALDALHATNNFPEWTGRVCPAPCEDACVLAMHDEPVSIRQIEKQIVDDGFARGLIVPRPAHRASGKRVAVVGSGPAGLAAAQQLARVGHAVTVIEREDRFGGLLRYGIPDFKLDKASVERRIDQLRDEGVQFESGVEVGRDVSLDALRAQYDAVCLCIGAELPRELEIEGRQLRGVERAMDYLVRQNRRVGGDDVGPLEATGKRVVILGGGDTAADCLGTALRQGASDVTQLHYKPPPPSERSADNPWPLPPVLLATSSSHEEGGDREFEVVARRFLGDDRVTGVVVEDARGERTIPADLVLIAIGFTGVERSPSGVALRGGTIDTDARFRTTVPGVFACGDARRGASLVVWAIWEGREAARAIDEYLEGRSYLPSSPQRGIVAK